MAASSVASDLRNFRRAGTLANRSRTSTLTPGTSGPAPCSSTSPARIRIRAPPLALSTSATAAMLARASPRNPRLPMASRSESAATLLVAWRTNASASSEASIPPPSSLTRIDVRPAPRTSMLTRRAPASSEFSSSSFTTEAGRSITSPAAIASATSGGRRRIPLTRMTAPPRPARRSSLLQLRAQLVQFLQSFQRAQRVGLELLELFAQRVGGHLDGQPELLLWWLQRSLPLELGQHLARTRDHRRRQAGQGGDMDPVRAVGATRDDPVQKTNRVALFENFHALVADAPERFAKRGQLVIVGSEKGPAAKARRVVQMLHDGLRDGDAVVSGGPPPHLVEDDQRRPRGVVEDVAGLGHLNHE